jgi:putative membrane protein
MMFLLRWLLNALGLWLATVIVPGVGATSVAALAAAGLLLGLANTLVRPVLVLLTLPLTLVTLGLFLVVVNAIVLLMVAALVPGFAIDDLFWSGILAALWMSLFALATQSIHAT